MAKHEMKKPTVRIPAYSLHEELMNAISHGVGALFAIAALVLCVVKSALHGDPWAVVSSAVYGTTLILMFTLSTIYHALKINKAKRVFRVLDHCGVFLVVAGSYTPYTLVTLRGPVGFTIFGIIWAFTILGIVFNALNVDRFIIISAVINLITGWGILAALKPLVHALPAFGVTLLLSGGVFYTLGAVLYAIGSKKKFFHSVFHVLYSSGRFFTSFPSFCMLYKYGCECIVISKYTPCEKRGNLPFFYKPNRVES